MPLRQGVDDVEGHRHEDDDEHRREDEEDQRRVGAPAEAEAVRLAQQPAGAHAWYIFPAWLADGRYAWLEADPAASGDYTFALVRAVIGGQATPLEMPFVSGAAWAPDGSALALCTTDEANAAGARVVVVELVSEGE